MTVATMDGEARGSAGVGIPAKTSSILCLDRGPISFIMSFLLPRDSMNMGLILVLCLKIKRPCGTNMGFGVLSV